MYTRYMDGIGLRCLSRVYHQPIKRIYEALKEYQVSLAGGSGTGNKKTRAKRTRPAQVLPTAEQKNSGVRKSAKRQNKTI